MKVIIMKGLEFEKDMSIQQNSQKKVAPDVITQGKWGEVPWQFVVDTNQPDISLCSAAFCIVTYQGKLVLVEHGFRGYEFTGGHVDPNEEIATTVAREVREESRAVIAEPKYFGYKKVSPTHPIPHRDNPNDFYPFPHSYVPYYFADASELLENEVFTSDIKSVRLVTYEEALQLLQPGHNHEKILDYLVQNQLINIW